MVYVVMAEPSRRSRLELEDTEILSVENELAEDPVRARSVT
jgi:hypothetical protein